MLVVLAGGRLGAHAEETGMGSDDPKDHFVAAFEIEKATGTSATGKHAEVCVSFERRTEDLPSQSARKHSTVTSCPLSFRFTGRLQPLASSGDGSNRAHTVSVGPTHCATDGNLVITAQYAGGSATTFAINSNG